MEDVQKFVLVTLFPLCNQINYVRHPPSDSLGNKNLTEGEPTLGIFNAIYGVGAISDGSCDRLVVILRRRQPAETVRV